MGMGTTYGSTSTTEGYIHNKYELGGSVRIIENTNATFDLTGVQLEIGATPLILNIALIPKNLPCVRDIIKKWEILIQMNLLWVDMQLIIQRYTHQYSYQLK